MGASPKLQPIVLNLFSSVPQCSGETSKTVLPELSLGELLQTIEPVVLVPNELESAMMAQERLAVSVADTTPLDTVAATPVGVQDETVSAIVTLMVELSFFKGGLNLRVPCTAEHEISRVRGVHGCP